MVHQRSAKTAKQRALGPHSRLLQRGTISGRSTEGRYIKAITTQLTAHIGGEPSAAQRLLIHRVAIASLRLELFDRKLIAGEGFSEQDSRVYGALHNSLRLMLRELGMKSTPSPVASLDDIAADIARAKREHALCPA